MPASKIGSGLLLPSSAATLAAAPEYSAEVPPAATWTLRDMLGKILALRHTRDGASIQGIHSAHAPLLKARRIL